MLEYMNLVAKMAMHLFFLIHVKDLLSVFFFHPDEACCSIKEKLTF